MSVKNLKDKISIGRKWCIGETITIENIAKFQETSFGEVVVFHATTAEGDEMVFTGGKAVVELMKQADKRDFPLRVKLVERLSANKRTYQDIEDGDEEGDEGKA